MTTANGILDASALADIVSAAPSPAWAQALSPKRRVAVLYGSSTAFGYGASSYALSVGGRLEAALKAIDSSWVLINTSVSGNGTQWALDNYMERVAAYNPAVVIHGTAIINEPGTGSDEIAAQRSFLSGRRRLQALDESIGAKTIQWGHYPNDTTNAVRYQCMLAAYAEMESWGPPVVNLLSQLDDGTGKFALTGTYNIDTTHVGDAGHGMYFDAHDLSWFTEPVRKPAVPLGSGGWELGGSTSTKAFPVVLSSPVKSWTMWARVKSKSGFPLASIIMAAMVYGPSSTPLRVRVPSSVALLTDSSTDLATSTYNPTSDFTVKEVTVVYNGALNLAYLYIDGVLIASATPAGTIQATDLFGFLSRPDTFSGGCVGMALSECAIWRAPLRGEDIASIKATGRIPKSSLAYHGKAITRPGSLAPNYGPGNALPNMGGASGWLQVAGF